MTRNQLTTYLSEVAAKPRPDLDNWIAETPGGKLWRYRVRVKVAYLDQVRPKGRGQVWVNVMWADIKGLTLDPDHGLIGWREYPEDDNKPQTQGTPTNAKPHSHA